MSFQIVSGTEGHQGVSEHQAGKDNRSLSLGKKGENQAQELSHIVIGIKKQSHPAEKRKSLSFYKVRDLAMFWSGMSSNLVISFRGPSPIFRNLSDSFQSAFFLSPLFSCGFMGVVEKGPVVSSLGRSSIWPSVKGICVYL